MVTFGAVQVRAQHVRVVRDGHLALDDVTLSVLPASRIQLWGAAGSGKTTLLKVLAGLIAPTSGTVWWNEHDPAHLDLDARRALQSELGMVFQTDALFDSLTVLENVELPLRKRKVSPEEARGRAELALEQVGLADSAHALPEQLSGGMRKRAGLARAIVAKPSVLLADDPLAGLDPHTARTVCRLLQVISEGRALVVCAPDPIPFFEASCGFELDHGRLSEVRSGPFR